MTYAEHEIIYVKKWLRVGPGSGGTRDPGQSSPGRWGPGFRITFVTMLWLSSKQHLNNSKRTDVNMLSRATHVCQHAHNHPTWIHPRLSSHKYKEAIQDFFGACLFFSQRANWEARLLLCEQRSVSRFRRLGRLTVWTSFMTFLQRRPAFFGF